MSIPILSKKPDKDITSVAFKNGTLREYQGFSSRFSHISSLGRGGVNCLLSRWKEKSCEWGVQKVSLPCTEFQRRWKNGQMSKIKFMKYFFLWNLQFLHPLKKWLFKIKRSNVDRHLQTLYTKLKLLCLKITQPNKQHLFDLQLTI